MAVVFVSCLLLHFITLASGVCNFGSFSSCSDTTDKNSCYFLKNRTSLTYNETENSEGIPEYSVEFVAFENHCGFDSYVVNVDLISNVAHEADCKYVYGFSKLKKIRLIKEENISPCTQFRLNFCMLYWFSGCYQLTFTPYNGTNSVRPVNYYVWMVNNYTQEDFVIHLPGFAYLNQEPFEAAWTFNPKTLRGTDEKLNVLLVPEENTVNVETSLDITDNCTLQDQKITCQYSNLTDGNYSLSLELRDNWRCGFENHLFGTCKWVSSIDYQKPRKSREFNKLTGEVRSHYLDWIIITSLIALVIGVVSGIYWYMRSRGIGRHSLEEEKPIEISLQNNVNKKIFLLYARDCQAFMDTMVEVRRYLEVQSKCKVYDIFDNLQFNEIAMSPHEYVEALLKDDNTNVVIIATECAERLNQSILKYISKRQNNGEVVSHISQSYCIPKALDVLVIHALKFLYYDVSRTSYKKFFVVRIPTMTDSNDYLMHVNPGTRFDLPNGLDTLMESMSFHFPPPQEKGLHDFIVNKESLHRSLYNLNEYVQRNPNYLRKEILNENIFI